MKLMLANVDYRSHMTSEGNELQLGLESAGWKLVGAGYDDGCRDVQHLLDRHRPEVVFVQDVRDWSPASPGSFRKDIAFTGIRELAKRKDVVRLTVCKDAGSVEDDQRAFAESINADAIVTYYHAKSVLAVSPWLQNYPLIRTYHTVDSQLVESIPMSADRKRALVSGAINPQVYPLRTLAVACARTIGADVLQHPGYSNQGCSTGNYLRTLAGYKVHVATASKFGFALRKIIESVAMGTTPVTDLPSYDVLPGIDSSIVRIPSSATVSQLKDAVEHAADSWSLEQRMEFAKVARELYDFRVMGARLDAAIVKDRVTA